jgi:hypothetical protein
VRRFCHDKFGHLLRHCEFVEETFAQIFRLRKTKMARNVTSNSTLVDEIQCYALPNGGIGFASHIITYCKYLLS